MNYDNATYQWQQDVIHKLSEIISLIKPSSQSIKAGTGTANDVLNERDWEIVAMKLSSGQVVDLPTHGISNLDRYLNDRIKDWARTKTDIHSVRRPSDNEVFSVGDIITWKEGNHGVIKSFEISPRNGQMIAKWFDDSYGVSVMRIFHSEKFRPPTANDVSKEEEEKKKILHKFASVKMEERDVVAPPMTSIPTLDRQDKKERIIVDLISYDKEKFNGKWGNVIKIWYPYTTQYAKWSSIKKAIEQILNDEEKKIIHCGNCGQDVSLHEPPHFKCPSIPTLERWDLKWEEGKAVLQKSPTGKWLLFEYPKNKL